MNCLKLLVVLSLINVTTSTTQFILLGSLGDLAKKYIWSALQHNIKEFSNLEIYGASRNNPEDGERKLKVLLNEEIPGIEKRFSERVSYLQLKTENDFQGFCLGIREDSILIFYLSIPPSAYIYTSDYISKHCRKAQIRVVYEKPFGYDSKSADDLFSALEKLFIKDSIYLVDHYLGKSVTQEILKVRKTNKNLELTLNKDYVSKIEINLLETVSCEGRAGYYDKSGVIRDMLQNHATELLMLITCDLADDFDFSKLAMLKSLILPNQHQVVVAQYERYLSHVGAESLTPTFASVLVMSSSPRWTGVPMVLSSGKSQQHETKQIIVTFKSGHQLEFSFKPAFVTYKGKKLVSEIIQNSGNSYITIVNAILNGQKSLLPSVDTVRESWNVWDHVIAMPKNLLLHQNNKNMNIVQHGPFLVANDTANALASPHMRFFRKAYLVTDHEEHLYEHLTDDIIKVANSVKMRDIHIAVSGGSTILGVFKYLLVKAPMISWKNVHIWQVDERCDIKHSNAKDLKTFLLDHVGIPTSNVHLMPVSTTGCDSPDEYYKEFKSVNPGEKFDYVVLGVGSDGHTASLFPKSTTLLANEYFKTVDAPGVVSPHRMTMTYSLINKSECVSILVTGPRKRHIIQNIRKGQDFPVTEVKCVNLTWFIDEILL